MAVRADDVDLGRDYDLVARFQGGDPQAFDDLYRRYFARLHRYCRRHTSDVHEAEEIAQEAFVRALSSMHTLEGERRFYPWMTVIARRISIDRHRRSSRIDLSDEVDTGTVDDQFDHVFAAVDSSHLRSALERVGPRHRDVLMLREGEALSYAEIAERLEVPVSTVEALLHRARKALRREFHAVSGDARGLWTLPLLGSALRGFQNLRTKVGGHWAEAAVAAPVAVGMVAATLMLTPGSTSPDRSTTRTTDATTAIESVVADPIGAMAPATGPVDLESASRSPGGIPDVGADPVAPTIDAEGVDVYIGREGAAEAERQRQDLPVKTDVGPVGIGIDPKMITDPLNEILDLLAVRSLEEGTR